MEKINYDNLLNEIKSLKKDENIFLDIDEDMSNLLKITDIKLKSYENLYISYINNTCERADKFNLDNFLVRYSDLYIKRQLIMKKIAKEILGCDCYEFIIGNNYNYNINYDLNLLNVFKIGGK
ncbi:hypothetical protein [Tissierella praeacuta]|uniref:hypothetical protein n=1 Tax=Tissierella praeacuta TaxID=43131 RepID=UPI001C123595|nr:hypothetical protein [Tissierella praeacuta]MBU5254987.1 hypothetical protein [Tissierella praeacuta]